ncbi:MAG: mechanosensitive ion channel family protein, partial [Maricaulaceae bacterium]
DRFLSAPAEPWVRVVNLGDSSVDLQLRAWVKAADYWEAKFATTRAVKEAFDAAGVEIPYPHQVEIQKKAG